MALGDLKILDKSILNKIKTVYSWFQNGEYKTKNISTKDNLINFHDKCTQKKSASGFQIAEYLS